MILCRRKLVVVASIHTGSHCFRDLLAEQFFHRSFKISRNHEKCREVGGALPLSVLQEGGKDSPLYEFVGDDRVEPGVVREKNVALEIIPPTELLGAPNIQLPSVLKYTLDVILAPIERSLWQDVISADRDEIRVELLVRTILLWAHNSERISTLAVIVGLVVNRYGLRVPFGIKRSHSLFPFISDIVCPIC